MFISRLVTSGNINSRKYIGRMRVDAADGRDTPET